MSRSGDWGLKLLLLEGVQQREAALVLCFGAGAGDVACGAFSGGPGGRIGWMRDSKASGRDFIRGGDRVLRSRDAGTGESGWRRAHPEGAGRYADRGQLQRHALFPR